MNTDSTNPITNPRWWDNPVVHVCILSLSWILTASILHVYGSGTKSPAPHGQSWAATVGPQFGLCCCMIGTVSGWYWRFRRNLRTWSDAGR